MEQISDEIPYLKLATQTGHVFFCYTSGKIGSILRVFVVQILQHLFAFSGSRTPKVWHGCLYHLTRMYYILHTQRIFCNRVMPRRMHCQDHVCFKTRVCVRAWHIVIFILFLSSADCVGRRAHSLKVSIHLLCAKRQYISWRWQKVHFESNGQLIIFNARL